MINLRNDLFAKLSVAAKNVKNSRFQNNTDTVKDIKLSPDKQQRLDFEEAIIKKDIEDSRYAETPSGNISFQDNYESIEHVTYREEIDNLRKELFNLEKIFLNLKAKDDDVDLLLSVGERIDALKELIIEKSLN